MASSKEYLHFIVEQLSDLDDISYRPMMGAKEMLLVDEVDSKEFLTELFEAMYDELPLPKRKNNGIGGITDELYPHHQRKH